MKRQKEIQKQYFDNFFQKYPKAITHDYDEEGNLYLCNGYWVHKINKSYIVIDPATSRKFNSEPLIRHDLNECILLKIVGYTPNDTYIILEDMNGEKTYYNKKYFSIFQKSDTAIAVYKRNISEEFTPAIIYTGNKFIGLLMPCRYEEK